MRTALPLLAALLLGCPADGAADAEATPAPRVVPVSLAAAAEERVVDPVVVTGIVRPARSVLVAAEASGAIVELPATLGASAQGGAPLARLDPLVATAQLDQARAQRVQAQAAWDLASAEGARADTLRDAGALTSRDQEASLIQRRTADAQLAAADAAVRLAERALQATTVRAPFAGIVAGVHQEVGALVGPGSPVAQLVDLATVTVGVGIPGREIPLVRPGQTATVHVPALQERDFAGVVRAVSPTSDPRTQTWPVEIEVANSDGALLGGMVARVEIAVGERLAVVVPAGALASSGGKDVVYVVRDERAQQRAVELGRAQRGRVELRAGVSVGEQVAVLGSQHLSDGIAVAPYDLPEGELARQEELRADGQSAPPPPPAAD